MPHLQRGYVAQAQCDLLARIIAERIEGERLYPFDPTAPRPAPFHKPARTAKPAPAAPVYVRDPEPHHWPVAEPITPILAAIEHEDCIMELA